ncbi:transposase [Candidatus Daviesbacteria bacterium]|nr:transposase [Candidatus Daviesbacteria bacterium]
MPYRIIPFADDQIYHIYNRGSEKRLIYGDRRDYQRFLKTLSYYQLEGPKPKLSQFFRYKNFKAEQAKKMVEILTFCLMPNHFHLLVKQLRSQGITEFMRNILNSYTKYFNTRYNRVGPLLQGQFKAVLIESDDQLVHVSRYIHLNPFVSFLIKSLEKYEWSSYHEYVMGKSGLCSKEEILSFFKSPKEYQNFIKDHAGYAQELELIKHKLIDED